ncbi:MAG: ORF6N domain-containing protein [Burkholderiales bacterium]|nr:ORF6N domain-containing protein [Burkholderiales bacterium]
MLLDADLAMLYGVQARTLNQAVARNRSRFPNDFMFRLAAEEYERVHERLPISSQSVMTSPQRRALRYRPYAFTEQGVAMLSSVLRSPRAVEVNIAIMRTFVQLRRLMASNRDLARKIEAMEDKYDEPFAVVFDAIKRLVAEDDARKTQPNAALASFPDIAPWPEDPTSPPPRPSPRSSTTKRSGRTSRPDRRDAGCLRANGACRAPAQSHAGESCDRARPRRRATSLVGPGARPRGRQTPRRARGEGVADAARSARRARPAEPRLPQCNKRNAAGRFPTFFPVAD